MDKDCKIAQDIKAIYGDKVPVENMREADGALLLAFVRGMQKLESETKSNGGINHEEVKETSN